MDAMDQLMRDRTTVIIAHSLSTIKNADHVIVINKGQLEMGAPIHILKQTDSCLAKMITRRPEFCPTN